MESSLIFLFPSFRILHCTKECCCRLQTAQPSRRPSAFCTLQPAPLRSAPLCDMHTKRASGRNELCNSSNQKGAVPQIFLFNPKSDQDDPPRNSWWDELVYRCTRGQPWQDLPPLTTVGASSWEDLSTQFPFLTIQSLIGASACIFALLEALGITLIYSQATKPNALHSEAEAVEPLSTTVILFIQSHFACVHSLPFHSAFFFPSTFALLPVPRKWERVFIRSTVQVHIDGGCMIAVELA